MSKLKLKIGRSSLWNPWELISPLRLREAAESWGLNLRYVLHYIRAWWLEKVVTLKGQEGRNQGFYSWFAYILFCNCFRFCNKYIFIFCNIQYYKTIFCNKYINDILNINSKWILWLEEPTVIWVLVYLRIILSCNIPCCWE